MIKNNKEEIIRIIKYIFSAGSSFVLDLVLFTIINYGLLKLSVKETTAIYLATILARIMSSIYNYMINSRIVFQNKSKKGNYWLLYISSCSNDDIRYTSRNCKKSFTSKCYNHKILYRYHNIYSKLYCSKTNYI